MLVEVAVIRRWTSADQSGPRKRHLAAFLSYRIPLGHGQPHHWSARITTPLCSINALVT